MRLAKRSGKSGNPFKDLADRSRARRGKLDVYVPIEVDRKKAVEFLTDLKDIVDRAGSDARLDLERHTVAAGRPGVLLRDGAGAREQEHARPRAQGAVARRLHVGDHAHAPRESAQAPCHRAALGRRSQWNGIT